MRQRVMHRFILMKLCKNANDNTTGTDLWVIVDKNSEDYIVDFYYDDKGFSVQKYYWII